MAALSQKSITVNLRPDLDKFVRTSSKRMKVSMNELINEAVNQYRIRQKEERK